MKIQSLIKYIIFLSLFTMINANGKIIPDIYIRLNQVGYLPSDLKSGIVLSNSNLVSTSFTVKNVINNKIVFTGNLVSKNIEYARFNYSYEFEFTRLNNIGEYVVEIAGEKSFSFRIGNNLYTPIMKKLLEFFKVQRCGYTNPEMHKVCHIADVSRLIDGQKNIYKKMDLTGGWHDAGDYVKFLNTTAFATYTLLFSYEFDPVKFGFDNDGNDVPDILEEAKIGLDWLLRANYKNKKFITQIQDLRDHNVGWRLPENDDLTFDRPAFLGIGKNLIGIYSATLTLGAKIWAKKFQYFEFSNKCLRTAEDFYAIRNTVPDIDTSGTGVYRDKSYLGKLALAAIELYDVTKNVKYYKDALKYGNLAGSDFWWSWGDINAFADYKIAKHNRKFADKIEQNLKRFNSTFKTNLFGEGVALSWGSNNTILGIALQNILFKRLTGKTVYDTLATIQRDFVLGRNPWGISFIYKTGTNFTKSFHHQIAFFNHGKLPGGFAAGPVNKTILDSSGIKFESFDKYYKFQTKKAYYRDDRRDFITNEPTISANATAIFVMGYFSKE